MKPYERAGAFYLGRACGPEAAAGSPDPLLYEARDLLTHAVIVGMTGSGKTGLGIALLEEAALDRIPAIVVDPKGDMANLLLQFPALAPSDFEPWIDPADAARAGHAIGEQAEKLARTWREGLAAWDQEPDRIGLLAESAEFTVYTPGSTAGRPLAILASLAAPAQAVRDDAELIAERIDATGAALLALLGIDFDPVQSRESILVANLLHHSWSRGEDLSLEELVSQVQSPPFDRLGVLDLETFYPAKDRARLALSLNALLASPSFAPWLTGERLDAQKLLWTSSGRPRVSVISIAHLSDRERVFFVSLLLSELLSWMRAQSGTSSLRALFYMDEIFGFFPPTAEPPTKRPMLTLLKQARAFGLGCVLATQNPVDLDYKGLANCGTWFLGRLQTERDKLRVLDGLEGALAAGGKSLDRAELDRLLSSLGPRKFLMSNVHADGPVLFQTRWVLSWLRGPMTRAEIRRLAEKETESEPDPRETATRKTARAVPPPAEPVAPGAPAAAVLPEEVPERFLACASLAGAGERLEYRPSLAVAARLHFVRAASGIDLWRDESVVLPLPPSGATIDWSRAESGGTSSRSAWSPRPEPGIPRADLTAAVGSEKSFARWRKELALELYRTCTLEQWTCKAQALVSDAGESRSAFLVRCRDRQQARRDEEIEKLRRKYAPKHAALLERVRQAQQRVDLQTEQYREERTSSWLTTGANLIGALFGRSLAAQARRASTTARAAASARKERSDIDRAEDDLRAARQRIVDLDAEVEREIAVIKAGFAAAEPELEPIVVRPRKSDVDIGAFTLLWRPWRATPDGRAVPAWR